MEAMRVQVRLAMEQGAVGMSSGLVYAPGPFAPKEELIELCKIVKEYNGFYVTHMRNESDTVEAALQEALDIAEATGVRLWISHHKAQGVKNFGKIKKTVAMMEDFLDWFGKDPRAEEYRHLTWEEEMEESRKAEQEEYRPNR